MARLTLHSPETRGAVETLLRQGCLRPTAIAARTGVPRSTVATWLRQLGLPAIRSPESSARRTSASTAAARRRPKISTISKPRRSGARPALTLRQRAALARLFAVPGLDPKDMAQAIGLRRALAVRTFEEMGLRTARATRAETPPPAPAALDAALRAHVARQIARFDARLMEGGAEPDSARVLRDLSGLRRLIDDMGRRQPRPDGDADAGPVADLAERRARLVRRLASFSADDLAERLRRRPDAARSGQP